MSELISRESFCEMAGIKSRHFATYLKREKIKTEADGTIDIGLSINKDFLKHRKSLQEKPVNTKKSVSSASTIPIKFDGDSDYEERRRVELEMKKRDLMMKDVQLQKMNGEVVPTELVGEMIKGYVHQLQMELKYSFERWAADMVIKMNGSKDEISKSRKVISEMINLSSEKARSGMGVHLERIVDDYRKAKGK